MDWWMLHSIYPLYLLFFVSATCFTAVDYCCEKPRCWRILSVPASINVSDWDSRSKFSFRTVLKVPWWILYIIFIFHKRKKALSNLVLAGWKAILKTSASVYFISCLIVSFSGETPMCRSSLALDGCRSDQEEPNFWTSKSCVLSPLGWPGLNIGWVDIAATHKDCAGRLKVMKYHTCSCSGWNIFSKLLVLDIIS